MSANESLVAIICPFVACRLNRMPPEEDDFTINFPVGIVSFLFAARRMLFSVRKKGSDFAIRACKWEARTIQVNYLLLYHRYGIVQGKRGEKRNYLYKKSKSAVLKQ